MFLEFIGNFLENELVAGQHFLFDCIPPSSLDEDHFASQFLKGDVPATEDVADGLRLSVAFLVCEHRHILLHATDDPHVHAAQVLLQQARLTWEVGSSLAGHWLTASQFGSDHAHIQQFMDQFVVLDEIAV